MSNTTSSSSSLYGLWLLMFVIVKVGGTGLLGWSWWWVLLPIVPDAVLILKKTGIL